MPGIEVDVGLGVLVLGAAAVAQVASLAVPWPPALRELFEREAPKGHPVIDPALLQALAWQESGFNPAAVSAPNTNGTRDYGLLQINAVNFAALGLTPQLALDPVLNVRAAVRHLRERWDAGQARGTVRNVADLVSIYNAGARADGGPRLAVTDAKGRASGGYVNASYVNAVVARRALVKVAELVPVKRIVTV